MLKILSYDYNQTQNQILALDNLYGVDMPLNKVTKSNSFYFQLHRAFLF